MPGGHRGMSRPAPVAEPRRPPEPPAGPASTPVHDPGAAEVPRIGGGNALIVAAFPLLQLLGRLRETTRPPFVGDLRARALAALRRFEDDARAAGVAAGQIRAAHVALCASLDDIVLSTPWGAASGWATPSLSDALHRDARLDEAGFDGAGEDGFFDPLARMLRGPAAWEAVLELMYLCLSLGVMGRYRARRDGLDEVERIRRAVHDVVAPQGNAQVAELSPHWAGVDAPWRRPRARLPVWVGGVLALAVAAGVFVLVSLRIGVTSDALLARMAAAPPANMPPVARPIAPVPPAVAPKRQDGPADRLRTMFADDIDRRIVEIVDTASTTLLRLPAKGLFATGGATLQSAGGASLERIGAALPAVFADGASAQVIGYTDDLPSRNVRFPSNFELSRARAAAVRDALARGAGGTVALSSEGRAEADPLASNTTADGRERNRRIEVVVQAPP